LTAPSFARTVASLPKKNKIKKRDARHRGISDLSKSSSSAPGKIQSSKIQPDRRAMKAADWKTYRTRFLVNAKKLSSDLTFTDSLGRQHSGRRGDYLVESSDGLLRIAPQQIFEDIYVPLALIDVENVVALDEVARVRHRLPQSSRDRRLSGDSARFN
jgi:hypothetical protein